MAELTKEQQVQAIYDLKVGYTLGHADIAILKAMARQLLASMEREPVAWMITDIETGERIICRDRSDIEGPCQPLYSAPQLPQPTMPETLPCPVMLEPGFRFGKGVRTQTMLDALQRRAEYYAELEAMSPERRADHDAGMKGFAAMLHGDRRDLTHPVDPQIAAYEKIMEQAVPDGWVTVPVEPTEGMVIAGFEAELREEFRDPEAWEAFEAMSGCEQAAHRAKLCWAAMIAAASKAL